ncbi:putative ribonuclease H-like domain-containing protein [Tanacetum coccineum]
MQPTFCILQDIRTGAIIGRGTERQGLYYVDEVTRSGTIMLSHGTTEREAWLWHRRLRHPSTGYLHTLFPKLFSSNCSSNRITSSKFFWPEALATAAYLINRLPTQILKSKSPLQILIEYTNPPSVLTLEPRIFGCTVFVYIPKSYRSKMDPCAEKCVFVGYGITQKGYRCYNPKTRHMLTTMNCDFLETRYYYASQHSGQGERECIDTLSWLRYVTYEEGRNHSTQNEPPFSTQPEDPNVSVAQDAPNLIPEVSNTHSSPISEPVETTNNTSGRHIGKICIATKSKSGSSTEKESRGSRYPIANIAKGNLSEEAKAFALSMYSDEIPANTKQALKLKHWKDAMEKEIKALIKTTHGRNVSYHQERKLLGVVKEEIYMEAPRGFTDSFGEREVCLLKKSLYGLKQSPRAWFGKFTLAMKHYGFKQRNDKEEITKLKKNLFTEFAMKDLGRLKYFLGIEVLRSKQGIFMYQKKYVLDLLAEIGMVDCKPADTPMIVNQKLYMEKKARLADKGRYQRMVGKLIYLSHTRPDIAHGVGVVSFGI